MNVKQKIYGTPNRACSGDYYLSAFELSLEISKKDNEESRL